LNDWKNHKDCCVFIKSQCDRYKEKKRKGEAFLESKGEKKKDDVSGECAICLEDIELPISLGCGHIFCVPCIMQYHASNPTKSSCPHCRGVMSADQLGTMSCDLTSDYVERAKRSDGAEREMYINLALRQIDTTLSNYSSLEDHDYIDELQINALSNKALVFGELNMHREVIDAVDESFHLCDNAKFVIDVDKKISARISKARAHLGLEEWQTALDMFRSLYEDCKDLHRDYHAVIAGGASRAHYGLCNYHEAIQEGFRAAYHDNRYRTGVHKYVALSQMKLGDIAAAKKTITQGILLEEQWNEENRKENEEVLRMILAEETENTKSKTKKKGKKKRRGRRNRIVEE